MTLTSNAKKFIVAFSGGADSALALHIASRTGKPLIIWYLHHYASPVESERLRVFKKTETRYPEAMWVKDSADVTRIAQRLGYSWEHTASLIRRKRLLRLRLLTHSSAVITGHNYSDYLETLELRRERKLPEDALPDATEQDAITGFWRPLYNMTRSEVREQCVALGFNFFDDPSNGDLRIARNRIRTLIPDPAPRGRREIVLPLSLRERGVGGEGCQGREFTLPLTTWSELDNTGRAQVVFNAFRRLAIVKKFTRNHFSRAHKLPFVLPPFFAHAEQRVIVFRRGLGDSVALPQSDGKKYLRGDAVTRKICIRKNFGKKSVSKLFSEKRLSPRQRRLTLVYLNKVAPLLADRIEFPPGIV